MDFEIEQFLAKFDGLAAGGNSVRGSKFLSLRYRRRGLVGAQRWVGDGSRVSFRCFRGTWGRVWCLGGTKYLGIPS